MGWNYEEDEDERKEYPVVGSVTLSTEEYTDLVSALFKARRKADKEHDDWYDAYKEHNKTKDKVKELEKTIESIKTKNAELMEWLSTSEELSAKFRLWKNEKLIKEQESEGEE